MSGLLLILVLGVMLALIMIFKQQPGKGSSRDDRSEGSEE